MGKHSRITPHYSDVDWAKMKSRNGYVLTPSEKFLINARTSDERQMPVAAKLDELLAEGEKVGDYSEVIPAPLTDLAPV